MSLYSECVVVLLASPISCLHSACAPPSHNIRVLRVRRDGPTISSPNSLADGVLAVFKGPVEVCRLGVLNARLPAVIPYFYIAFFLISWAISDLLLSDSFLESLSSEILTFPNITAAATTGPTRLPLPTSSTPAINSSKIFISTLSQKKI